MVWIKPLGHNITWKRKSLCLLWFPLNASAQGIPLFITFLHCVSIFLKLTSKEDLYLVCGLWPVEPLPFCRPSTSVPSTASFEWIWTNVLILNKDIMLFVHILGIVSFFFDAFWNASPHSGFSSQVNTCKGSNGTSDLVNSTQPKVIILEFILNGWQCKWVHFQSFQSSALWRGCDVIVRQIF